MRKRCKTRLCLLLALLMAAMFLPQSLAQEQPGTPTDLPEGVAAPVQQNPTATDAYDKKVYSENDVNVINAVIESNGLGAQKDDPANWGFVTWSGGQPKRITALSLGEKGLTGTLDVRGLSALKRLNCYKNQLSSLELSGLTGLQALYCYDNQLSSLELSGLTGLQELYCSNNQLSSLELSGLTGLHELYCDNNQLSSLELSGLTGLQRLYCYKNQLSSLELSGLTGLQELYCSKNQLSSLELSGLTGLQALYCYDNQLSSLDVRGLTALEYLHCENNKFTSLNLTGLSENIGVAYCNLTQLTDPSGAILTVESSENGFVQIRNYKGQQKQVKLQAYAKLGYTFEQWSDDNTDNPRENIPFTEAQTLTPNFVQETDPRYHAGDVAAVEKLIVDHQLEGKNGIRLGYPDTYPASWQDDAAAPTNKRLTALSLSNLSLTGSLDVRGLTGLESLDCYNNQLTSLELSGLTALEYLDCYNNQLSSLDVSGLTALIDLGCAQNPLASLVLPDGKSIAVNVTGSGQPWLENFDYQNGQPVGKYITKPADGYGNAAWSNPVGCTVNPDGTLTFDFASNGNESNVSADLTFTRIEPIFVDPDTGKITGEGVQPGGQVQKGSTFTFTANPIETGASYPIYGDIRYMPENWKVNPSGDFSSGYTQSFSTVDMALGDHALTVTYRMQRYDGTAWEPLPETIDKTFNFTLVEQVSPPITPPEGNTPGGGQNGANGANGTNSANPGTGDSGYAWYILGLALAGGAMLLMARKKKTA